MKRYCVLLALAAAGPMAQASELSYSYLDAGIVRFNPSGGSSEDGVGLRFSAELSDRFHFVGGYEHIDLGPFSADLFRLGVGYNHAMGDRSDFVTRLRYENVDGENGWSLELGVRGAIGERFDGFIGLGYIDGSDASGEAYASLEGHFRFGKSWGLVAQAEVYEDGHILFVGPRATF